MKYTFDPSFPTRPMTTREKNLIDHIATQTLFLENELFFSIGDILSRTGLILSGEKKTRQSFPDPAEIQKEIDRIRNLSNAINSGIERQYPDCEGDDPDHRGVCPVQSHGIVGTFAGQKKVLEGILASASVPASVPVLGAFGQDASGRDIIVLYVDNIDAEAGGNQEKATYLMVYTLLHECWHAFFHNAGIGTNPTFSCAEEPMAEYGALVMLDYVLGTCIPESSLRSDIDRTLQFAKGEVKSKQNSVGYGAAYGFGYYIFERHLNEAKQLLADFANISSIIDPDAVESQIYKYLVYPVYPTNESNAFLQLIKLMAAAELYGFTLPGPCTTLNCKVKRSRLDIFNDALVNGSPNLSQSQIKNADLLYFAMRQHPEVRFTYLKNDGSVRHAAGTLMNDLYDAPSPASKSINPLWNMPDAIDSQLYYDTNSNGLRQFKYENLVSVNSNVKLSVI